MTSMKRALVFLVLGPAGVAFIGCAFLPSGLIAIVLFLFTLAVSVFGASVDALARDLPISVKAPLAAIVGAMAASGLAGALLGKIVPQAVTPLALGGALCMCVCSLLSHDYGSSPSIRATSAAAGP
jgi:ABC-type multidrug transport system permease subunit